MAISYILSSNYFTDVQEKPMIGMKVIQSVFLQNMVTMETSKIAKSFSTLKMIYHVQEILNQELLSGWRVCCLNIPFSFDYFSF